MFFGVRSSFNSIFLLIYFPYLLALLRILSRGLCAGIYFRRVYLRYLFVIMVHILRARV